MVFELVSNVYERNSVEIIQKSTKLYKALQIDLQVDNAFNKEVLFNISVRYERNGVIKGKNLMNNQLVIKGHIPKRKLKVSQNTL